MHVMNVVGTPLQAGVHQSCRRRRGIPSARAAITYARSSTSSFGYLHDRLARTRHAAFNLSDEARDKLAEAGFDPVYGARPLKRAIQQQVENPLANEILSGKFKPGDVIDVGVDDDQLAFRNAA